MQINNLKFCDRLLYCIDIKKKTLCICLYIEEVRMKMNRNHSYSVPID